MSDWIDPPVHFLTWRTYGTWLPGDNRGWIDERRNGYGEPTHAPDPYQENRAAAQMSGRPITLSDELRLRVDRVIREACGWRSWSVIALNVRSNHVHLVLAGEMGNTDPLTALKARVTKVLWDEAAIPRSTRIWARGGSHRLLRRPAEVEAAMDYVMNRQGSRGRP